MKSLNKKLLLGSLSTAAIVAPVATLVSCGTDVEEIKEVPGDTILWTGANGDVKATDLEDQLKTDKESAASENFLSEIKYEVSTELYNKEQKESISYQGAFIKWKLYTLRKDYLALAKDIFALKHNGTNLNFDNAEFVKNFGQEILNHVAQADRSDKVNTTADSYVSTDQYADIIALVKTYANDQTKLVTYDTNGVSEGAEMNDSVKTSYKDKVNLFKDFVTNNINKENEKLAKIQNTDGSWKTNEQINWESSTFTTDFPMIMKPYSKLKETQTKTYNEAKAAFIDSYKTKPDGDIEWAKKRSESYNGATTDEEAIKFMTNTSIQAQAFGSYSYKINQDFTLEQFAAIDKDGNKIFPWLKFDIADKDGKDKDNKDVANPLGTTKELSFDKSGTKVKYEEIKAESPLVELPSIYLNKIYFLSRKTMIQEKLVVDMSSTIEQTHFDNTNAPIEMTHALIMAKPSAEGSTLPWDVSKDTLKNILLFSGSGNNGMVTTDSQGMGMWDNLFGSSASDKEITDKFTQYISDDTGSRKNKGALGVQTFQWYSRPGGMNDGFALGTMAAFADMKDNAASTSQALKDRIDVSSGVAPIGSIIDDLRKAIVAELPTSLTSLLYTDVTAMTLKTDITVANANRAITEYITKLSDEDVKNKFGSVFRDIFTTKTNGRELAYKISEGVYMLVAPDSGVHVVKIETNTQDWTNKLHDDLKAIAADNDLSKAKVKWDEIYKTIFTDENIVKDLLQNPDVKNAINNIKTSNPELFQKWVDAKYMLSTETDIAKVAIETIEKIQKAKNLEEAKAALGPRIDTYLTQQIDARQIDVTIDVAKIYDSLLAVLTEDTSNPALHGQTI